VCASVNLLLHHKVQKFSSGTGSPGWSGKRAIKQLLWWLLQMNTFGHKWCEFYRLDALPNQRLKSTE